MEFTFVKLVFTLRLEEDTANPLVLFGLRGGFEPAFREEVGCARADCADCPSAPACPYHRIFARALSSDPAALRRFQKPSLPFVFDIPRLPPSPNRGAVLELGLTLLGEAAQHVPTCVGTLRRLTRPGATPARLPVRIEQVESVAAGGTHHSLQEGDGALSLEGMGVLSLGGLVRGAVVTPRTLDITFVTPLRLVHEGRPLLHVSFSAFARALMRRVSSLAYYYGGVELDHDYAWLARESELIESDTTGLQWVDWGRTSPGGRVGGLVGRAFFTGDMTDFHPFLLLGEHIHLGKGAAYGLGAYRIEKFT